MAEKNTIKLAPFVKMLESAVKHSPKRIVLPEGDDPRIQQTVEYLLQSKAVKQVWLSDLGEHHPWRADSRVRGAFAVSGRDPRP